MTRAIKFVDLVGQYERIKPEIDAAIGSVIQSGAFVGGGAVASFERNFSAFCEGAHCVGVANGTDALEIILECLRLPAGSEIIVPANSFVATSEPVARAGYRVVFVDSDPVTYTIDVEDLRRRVTANTSAVIAVHLYGHPCNMSAIMGLARAHGFKVIEDCAQAHGTAVDGAAAGTMGDAAAFSFYPGKNLGAYGDGGAIVTRDAELARVCRMLANHGRVAKYDHAFNGRNSRLDAIQAAVLDVKLRHIDSWVSARNQVALAYSHALQGIDDLILPTIAPGCDHAFHLYVVRTTRRDELAEFLKARGVETGVHYPIALTKLPAYAHLGQQREPMFANVADGEVLSLPIGEHVTEADVEVVAGHIKEFFGRPYDKH